MGGDWDTETARARRSFDAIADLYLARFSDELDRKPFDRDFLDRVAPLFPRGHPVLEVGAGPAQMGRHIARHGVDVVASDISGAQLAGARALVPSMPLMAADLARLPVRDASVAGVVAFYCLIYGAAAHLDAVFAEWRRALVAGGLAVLAVHAGEGATHHDRFEDRAIDLTLVLRNPDDLAARLRANGFHVDELTVRPPYDDEHPTERCYVMASAEP